MTFGKLFQKLPSSLFTFLILLGAMGYVIAPSEGNAAITKRVFLTSGTSWTVPSDWNSSNNSVEAIGSGGAGASSINAAGGGGGGAYARSNNLTLTGGASITYKVTGDTVFNNAGTDCNVGNPCADGGTAGSGTTGGAGGTVLNSSGTAAEFAGGAGANGSGAQSGGGGGAAGPGGAGGAASGGNGGTSSGAGGIPHTHDTESDTCTLGSAGGAGTEYATIPTYGSGGGGGGGVNAPLSFTDCFPTDAGSYGAGGGGGTASVSGGNGAGGLIVITYESTDTGSSSNAKVKIQGGRVKIIGGRVLIR